MRLESLAALTGSAGPHTQFTLVALAACTSPEALGPCVSTATIQSPSTQPVPRVRRRAYVPPDGTTAPHLAVLLASRETSVRRGLEEEALEAEAWGGGGGGAGGTAEANTGNRRGVLLLPPPPPLLLLEGVLPLSLKGVTQVVVGDGWTVSALTP